MTEYFTKKIAQPSVVLLQYSIAYLSSQMREQMSGPDLHVFTLKFLAQFFFDFCLPLFYATSFQFGP